MSAANLFVLIIPRELTDGYGLFLWEKGLRSTFSFPCEGTASGSILHRLGLEKNEKTLIWSMMDEAGARKLLRSCVSDMGLNMPGNGIALRIPVQAVGGESSLRALAENMPIRREGDKKMEQKIEFPCVLITAICESGHTGAIMDAARQAGAGGGTVVHAKGTAGAMAEKFRGISLAQEKDMVLILSARKDRDPIMRAIMDRAGIDSPAHTVLFTLPVESVAGLRSLMPEEEEEAEETVRSEEAPSEGAPAPEAGA